MLLSVHQAHHEIATGQLVALPHPGGPVVRAIGLTLRRDWHPTSAQAELVDIIRRTAATWVQVSPGDSGPPRSRKARGETPVQRVKKRLK